MTSRRAAGRPSAPPELVPPAYTTPAPPESLLNIPGDVGQFMQLYQQELEKFQEIPGYGSVLEANKKQVGVLDENNKWLGTFSINLQVAQAALKRWQDQLGDQPGVTFGGLQRLPEDTSFSQLFAMTKRWETILDTQVGQQNLSPFQQFMFWDESERAFRPLTTQSEALRFAIEELTKVEKAKITGVFNVPEGGEVLVAFQALTAGFYPSNQLPGGAGGAVGAASQTAAGQVSTLGGAATRAAAYLDAWQRIGRPNVTERGRIGPANREVEPWMVNRRDHNFASPLQLTINNRNVFSIDSRVVVDRMSQTMARQLSSVRRGSAGGGRGHLMM